MRPCARLVLIAVLVRGERAAAQLARPKIDTLPNHVVRVRNSGPAAWTGMNGWHLVLDHTIAPGEGTAGTLLNVAGMSVGDDGSVVVTEHDAPFVKVFGATGALIRTFGANGEGPGEMRAAFGGITHDTVVMQDHRLRRLTLFRKDGTLLTTIPSSCCTATEALLIDEAGRAWVPTTLRGVRGWVRVALRGRAIDTVRALTEAEEGARFWSVTRTVGQSTDTRRLGIPNTTMTWLVPRPDGLMLMGNTATLRAALVRTKGDTVRVFEAPGRPKPMTREARETMMENMIDGQPDDFKDAMRKVAKLDDIPVVAPSWFGVTVDGYSNMWINGAGDGYMIFDPNGVWLGNMPQLTGVRGIRNMAVGKNHLAALIENEAGEQSIQVYRIDKGK